MGRVDRVLFPVQSLDELPARLLSALLHSLTHPVNDLTQSAPTPLSLSLFMARTQSRLRQAAGWSSGRSGVARLKIRLRNTTVSSSTEQPSADGGLANCPLLQGRTLLSFLEGQLKLDSQRLNTGREEFEPPSRILPATESRKVLYTSERDACRLYKHNLQQLEAHYGTAVSGCVSIFRAELLQALGYKVKTRSACINRYWLPRACAFNGSAKLRA